MRRRSLGLGLLLLAACASDAPQAKRAVAVPWAAPGASSSAGSAARWGFVPRRAAPMVGVAALYGDRRLLFGRHGERWIHDGAAATAEAAGDLASEDLVALARPPGGAWLFVGAAGTVFEAAEPLGAFVRIIAPPEPVAHVDAAGALLASVTRRGSLVLSRDGGGSFVRAPIDGFVTDVALIDDRAALALVQPERLVATADGGATWATVDAPSIGASRLVHGENGSITAVGWFSALSWQPGRAPSPRDRLPPPRAFALDVELGLAPDAQAAREGRAFVRHGTFFVAMPPSKRGEAWSIGQAKLGERLSVSPLAGTETCSRLALDGDDRVLIGACSSVARGQSAATVRLLRWQRTGDEPETLAWPLEGPVGEARVALKGDSIVAWGVCRPGGAHACEPDAPLSLARWETVAPAPAASASAAPSASAAGTAEPSSPWVAASAPAMGGRPLALRIGEGGAVYLVARRAKPRDVALFVSHDGGRSFEPRDLGVADDPRLAASISTADAGVVTVAIEGTNPTVILTDEDGRVVASGRPPVSSVLTHLALDGRRVLAIDGSFAHESLDGGSTWNPLGPQPALACDPKTKCEHAVVCAREGCLVGQSVARLGWGGAGALHRSDVAMVPTPVPRMGASLPPVVCRLGKEKWAPLPRGLVRVPSANDAERGKSAWAAFAEDPTRASLTMVQALTGGKVEETVMLPPVKDGSTMALGVTDNQVEGAAAVRFALSEQRRFEVVWANLFEGKVSRATVDDATALRTGGSYEQRGVGLSATARWRLLSITAGGIFFAPVSLGEAPLYFLDHRGRSERSVYPAFPRATLDGANLLAAPDAVRVDGKSVPVANVHPDAERREGALTADTVGLVRARPQGNGFVFDSLALAPSSTSPFGVTADTSFAYIGDAPVFVVRSFSEALGATSVDLFPFRADGLVVGGRTSAPSQTDAANRPRACTAADRTKTARVVVPWEVGTRRGIVVEAPDGTRFSALASNSMVLYGTPESPCIAAIDGVPVREDDGAPAGDEADRVLVYPGDMEHGWFFRAGVDGNTFETRPMRCRVDPNASLPPALERVIESGARVPVKPPPRRRPARP